MNVGENVTIRVRDPRNAKVFASGVVTSYHEYSGKILPNPKWVGQDSICISTGLAHFPFRVIDRERILELGIPASASSAPRSETFIVKGSKPGTTYTVTRDGSHWGCTCVGFGFRKDCKHVRECK
jgi:hypothetical protein